MKMTKNFIIVILALGIGIMSTMTVLAASPEDPMVLIRDITRLEGMQENMLFGIGVVVGLNGTGDSRFSVTAEMLHNFMTTFGIVAPPDAFRSKNVAAVQVQAMLPPFARQGDKIDISVHSMGDAKSLQGGTLLLTSLQAANGQVYISAMGPVSIGGFGAGTGGNTAQQNHLQVGRIPNGGIITRTLEVDFTGKSEIDFLLNDWNFETASLMVQAINDNFKETRIAEAVNAGRVKVKVPDNYRNNITEFIARVQGLQVRASMPARIVINERTGTIVIGHAVRISTVAVAHGNLTVTISTQSNITEKTDEDGNTETTTETTVQLNVTEEKKQLIELKTGPTVGDVVKALNAIGASPRDIIAILQAMKQSGALYAQLELI